MAKPRQHHNGPDIYGGGHGGASEEVGEGVAVETEEEERGVRRGGNIKNHPRRRADGHEEGYEANGSGEETEAEEEDRHEEEKYRDGETPRGTLVEVTHVGGGVPPPEENADFPGFLP